MYAQVSKSFSAERLRQDGTRLTKNSTSRSSIHSATASPILTKRGIGELSVLVQANYTMTNIITLTINPAIDVSIAVERVSPVHKLRCTSARRDPGGGGINVARVLKRLGADVVALYPTGGVLGALLRQLVTDEEIPCLTIGISEETRENITVLDQSIGQQYRFILPGPRLSELEWRACLDAVASLLYRDASALGRRARFVVASGSLPPGVPEDFYGLIARATKQAGAKIVVDSSGVALKCALEAGVYLVKPSLRELKELTGKPMDSEGDWIIACRSLIDDRRTEMVALTLGDQGSLLVTRDRILRAQALPIEPVSVVGAGDSFLGGMIESLTSGHAVETALRYGVAAGSASLLMPGTQLCQREDVEQLVNEVRVQTI
jgi:6-phosphofructokinase 2